MAQGLSAECLQQIISYNEDDSKTLHSCLLVNRFWCHNTIGILWGRPWRSHSITQTSATKLIQTYVACLPEESKKILYNNGIRYQLTSVSPIFDYASFLRALDYDCMFWSISQWLISCWLYRVLNYEEEVKPDNEHQEDRVEDCIGEENERKTILVARELCNLFKNRCRIFHDLFLHNRAIQSDFPFLPSSSDTTNYLANLREFVCLGDNKSKLLLAMSKVCSELRRIFVGFPLAIQWKTHYNSDAMSYATLIESQTRLESICLYGYKSLVAFLIDSLISQSKTLHTLELMYTDFREEQDCGSIMLLPACKNLKSLKIYNCFIPPDDRIMPLTSFLQLEEFDFCNEWNPLYPLPQHEFWEEIFHNTENSLRKMSLWWIRADPKDGAQIIESIAKQCSNISFLHLPVLWINEILLLFNHCKQLKEFSFSGDDFDANESLTQLGILVPIALRSLTIRDGHIGGWTFTERSLEYFLLICRANLQKVDLTRCSCMTDRHFEVIARRGIAKC
ncbi:hypothetical protein C1645_828665 [Glomus cerebriforme]|uniref:F-box domain-containing protein n=1 Tax=Glomus cerebriforme TaxID=658196 RepID=A0A397SLD4_9GLOM|nr:hypothetical protein C1645_828665 [Glomus cerebriforme]